MALFRIADRTPLAPAEAWRRLTAWERHAAQIPLTRITVTHGNPTRQGTRLVARTGIGRLGFDDPMEVTVWEPPYHCRLEKHGRVVTGWAEIDVREEPDGGSGARVLWTEDLRLRGLPRVCDPLLARAGKVVFGRAMRAMLRSPGER
ncbi:SRPBCC family protein [Streptomyces sp. NPDC051561]|uniref:SRPBCC family protein n=1 Tax=Streptomyces sp. NPDC051561 TaxID=3365658 RepID=UPI0037A6FB4D